MIKIRSNFLTRGSVVSNSISMAYSIFKAKTTQFILVILSFAILTTANQERVPDLKIHTPSTQSDPVTLTDGINKKLDINTMALDNDRNLYYEETYQHHNYRLYFGEDGKLSWIKAFQKCKTIGYDLLDLETMEEQNFIFRFLKYADLEPNINHLIWTSASDMYSEGNFIWMTTGKEMDPSLWDKNENEPNSYGSVSENCVDFLFDTDKQRFILNDNWCEREGYYICKGQSPKYEQ